MEHQRALASAGLVVTFPLVETTVSSRHARASGPGPRGARPYRFLRHPDYVAVAGELVSAALLIGAALTGPSPR